MMTASGGSGDVTDAMVQKIVHGFAPLRVILFGSRARGEANPDSDVDLLVVFDQAPDKRQLAIAIRRTLRDFMVPKDILVTTPEEIRRTGRVVGTVLRSAIKDGKVLYERKRPPT